MIHLFVRTSLEYLLVPSVGVVVSTLAAVNEIPTQRVSQSSYHYLLGMKIGLAIPLTLALAASPPPNTSSSARPLPEMATTTSLVKRSRKSTEPAPFPVPYLLA